VDCNLLALKICGQDLQLLVLLHREVQEYATAAGCDCLIQHQPTLLISDPATTLNEFNDLVG